MIFVARFILKDQRYKLFYFKSLSLSFYLFTFIIVIFLPTTEVDLLRSSLVILTFILVILILITWDDQWRSNLILLTFIIVIFLRGNWDGSARFLQICSLILTTSISKEYTANLNTAEECYKVKPIDSPRVNYKTVDAIVVFIIWVDFIRKYTEPN